MVAPVRTPQATVAQVSGLIARSLREPDLQQRFAAPATRLVGSNPEEFAAVIVRERPSNLALIQQANFRIA